MGYTTTDGAVGKGLGAFTDTASTASDLNKLLELVGRMGNVRVGTEAERDALTGSHLFDGLLFVDEDTGKISRYDGGWSSVYRPATATGSITPTAGAGFTLSSNNLFTRDGWLMGTIVWTRTSGTLSHADIILTMPAGYGPLYDIPVGGSMGPSNFVVGPTGLFRASTRDVQALSPEMMYSPGRTSGTLSFCAPIAM